MGGSDPRFLGAGPPETLPAAPRGRSRPPCARVDIARHVDAYIVADVDDDTVIDVQRDRRASENAGEFVNLSRSVLRCNAGVVSVAVER